MTASPAVELQRAIVGLLEADAALSVHVGARIYDGPPKGAVFPYLSLGASDGVVADALPVTAREETVQIDIWSRRDGSRAEAREITDAVRAALHRAEADLGLHALVDMRVTLWRVFLDPDGLTAHGVVQVTALIEEAV